MAARSFELSSLSLLRYCRVLAHDPLQPLVRPPRHNLHYLRHLFAGMYLAGLCQHLVAHVRRPVRARVRNRSQIGHCTHLCRRNESARHQRRAGHAMADVDCIRNHVWLCR